MNAETNFREAAPLYDIEIEQALLGVCLVDAAMIAEASALLDAGDFVDPLHQRLWAAMVHLRDAANSVTPITVGAFLMDDPGLGQVGGRAYLTSIAHAAPPLPNIRDYCRIVRDLALRRRLDAELEAARSRILVQSAPVLDALAGVLDVASIATDRAARGRGHMPLAESVDAVMQGIEDAMNGKAPPAILTGLTRLDALTGGFQAADLVVVAGRPGCGKTVLLSTICRAAAQITGDGRPGAPAILFELEMTRQALIQRLACDLDFDRRGVNKPLLYTRLRNGRIGNHEFSRTFAAAQDLRALPIEIFDADDMTIDEIGAHADRFAQRSKTMGVIVIDYLQIVSATDRYAGSRVQEVTEISNKAKRMAKRIGWPVVVGCQLSREIEKRDDQSKRPRLSDLRESGAIEQDADIVIGMHRPGYYIELKRPLGGRHDAKYFEWEAEYEAVMNDLELSVLKNRSGAPGVVKCFVDIGASAIRNTKDDAGAGRERENFSL